MITNITLENFKCFRYISVDPKLITVFIGPNGTGKSGVLQALLLLKQSRDNVDPLRLEGDLVGVEPNSFMFRGPRPGTNVVNLSFSGDSEVDAEGEKVRANFEMFLSFDGDGGLRGKWATTKFPVSGVTVAVSANHQNRTASIDTPRSTLTYNPGPGLNGFQLMGLGQRDPQFAGYVLRASQTPASIFANMRTVPAARGLTRETYQLGPNLSSDIPGAAGLGAQEEETVTTLAYSRRDVEKVSQLMKNVTGVGFRTDTVPPQSAMPVSESLVGDFSLAMEGFGTNALVHLLFEVVRAVPGATVLIEEPEIHLHPKAQADLASVLVEQAKADEKQLVMTTHSEHIVGRLLTSVAEGKLSADELAIYSFEKDDEGVCSASEIEVNERGQVTGGLKSFFETDLDEMRRYVDALRAKA